MKERGFPGSSVVKNQPANQETEVWSLAQEDTPEKEMATHSSILAWKISWTELVGYQPWGRKSVRHSLANKQQWKKHKIEKKGKSHISQPLVCSRVTRKTCSTRVAGRGARPRFSDSVGLRAKFRLKLKKVGKTTRPFRYDLNWMHCDYTVEVRNGFKGLEW